MPYGSPIFGVAIVSAPTDNTERTVVSGRIQCVVYGQFSPSLSKTTTNPFWNNANHGCKHSFVSSFRTKLPQFDSIRESCAHWCKNRAISEPDMQKPPVRGRLDAETVICVRRCGQLSRGCGASRSLRPAFLRAATAGMFRLRLCLLRFRSPTSSSAWFSFLCLSCP